MFIKLFNKAFILLFTIIGLFISMQTQAVTQIHVATHGSANGNGSLKMPYLTLEQARNKVRHLPQNKKSAGVEVVIHQGNYLVNETIQFWQADSGKNNLPITYKNAQGDKVVFFGGTILDKNDFQVLTEQNFIAG